MNSSDSRQFVGLPDGNPKRVEPYDLAWHHLAKVLREEAWWGRWSPFEETNIAPLAGITAEALIKGFERIGLRLMAHEIDAPNDAYATEPTQDSR